MSVLNETGASAVVRVVGTTGVWDAHVAPLSNVVLRAPNRFGEVTEVVVLSGTCGPLGELPFGGKSNRFEDGGTLTIHADGIGLSDPTSAATVVASATNECAGK
jgi:hypothetical protein